MRSPTTISSSGSALSRSIRSIDALQHAIEEKAVLTIARRQPMAIDLREIIGSVRISNDLERVGDLAKNIGKRILPLAADVHPENLMLGVERMGELVLGRMRGVLDGYAGATSTWRSRCGTATKKSIPCARRCSASSSTYMMEDAHNITYCIHLMFCAKNIERMGDHATNIAETVYYIIEGRAIAEQRPKGDTTSFASMLAEKI